MRLLGFLDMAFTTQRLVVAERLAEERFDGRSLHRVDLMVCLKPECFCWAFNLDAAVLTGVIVSVEYQRP
jgi:hypothetical protein